MCTKHTLSTMNDDCWLCSTLLFLMTYGNGRNYKNLFSTFKRADILVLLKSYFKNLILLYFIYFSEDSESRIKAYP